MKYLIQSSTGEDVAKNLLPSCSECFASTPFGESIKRICPADQAPRRLGRINTESGLVCLCSPSEADVNSTRVFRARMAAYTGVLEHVKGIRADIAVSYNQQLSRLMHNLTSLNAHCIQEMFALVSQDTLTKNIGQQIKYVRDAMSASPDKAARTFLRIAKNNLAMKSEFVAMRFLDEKTPRPAFRVHAIRKVVLNVLHAFFQDFTDHDVHVNIEESKATVLLDYDTFHVALYHVIDNATKYVMPHSKIFVSFNVTDGKVNIVFDMFSVPIPAEEKERIGEEGFSGNLARGLLLAGHGMGMFRTKRLMAVNDGELIIRANIEPSRATTHNGIEYQENQFILSLLVSQKRR